MNSGVPTASVLMPVYNGRDLVLEAVRSVLEQTFDDFEFIIIDDGSDDGTSQLLESVRDPRVRILHNPQNLGLASSLKRGLDEARGEFVARMDHDDFAFPERLEKQIEFLRTNPGYVAVGCQLAVTEDSKEYLWRWPVGDLDIRWQLLFDTALSHPGLLGRTAAFRAAGGYDDTKAYPEDYDLEC